MPRSVLDALYDPRSPFRPAAGLLLGKTPVPTFGIPMGSYLLVLHKEGFLPVRCPVHIGRNETETADVTLYGEGEIPEGFAQIPAGKFVWQGDPWYPDSTPRGVVRAEDYFLSRFPVKAGDYLDFLNELAARDPEEALQRSPRRAPKAGHYWPRGADDLFVLPTEEWAEGAPADILAAARKLDQCPVWWAPDWPVVGVSWEDLMTYAAWARGRIGWPVTLAHDVLWEKAARGVDARYFPWGNTLEFTFCNTSASHEEGKRVVPVTDFPADESVYGVRGMAGNSRDLCLNLASEAYPRWRPCRGGVWINAGFMTRAASRTGLGTDQLDMASGGRLAFYPKLPVERIW